jgi:hypothetical protein
MYENLSKSRLQKSRWYDKHQLKTLEFTAGDDVMVDRCVVQTQ